MWKMSRAAGRREDVSRVIPPVLTQDSAYCDRRPWLPSPEKLWQRQFLPHCGVVRPQGEAVPRDNARRVPGTPGVLESQAVLVRYSPERLGHAGYSLRMDFQAELRAGNSDLVPSPPSWDVLDRCQVASRPSPTPGLLKLGWSLSLRSWVGFTSSFSLNR